MSSLNQKLWTSIEELEGETQSVTPSPAASGSLLDEPIARRRFLQLLGASAGMAGLSSCMKGPPERVIPYVIQPEELIPGESQHFATHVLFDGYAKGVLATSREGRPIKLEGAPGHSAVLGKSDLFTQAELLELYDPARSSEVRRRGVVSSWDSFAKAVFAERARWQKDGGRGVRILSRRITSPALLSELKAFLQRYPLARWVQYEPIADDAPSLEASRLAFGRELRPIYDFSAAKLVLSFDCDFLGPGPFREAYVRDFIAPRKALREAHGTRPTLNPLFMIESSISITGALADWRRAVRPSEVGVHLHNLASLLKTPGAQRVIGDPPEWLAGLARKILSNEAGALVLAGAHLPSELQALAYAINARLGALNRGLRFAPPVAAELRADTVQKLVDEISHEQVTSLFILGANPVYDTPGTLHFKDKLRHVPFSVHLGGALDETGVECQWSLPESHSLETWGDAQAYDGTISIQQPLITRLHESRSALEVLSILAGAPGRTGRQMIQERWGARLEQALRDGQLHGEKPSFVEVHLLSDWRSNVSLAGTSSALEAVFRTDPTIHDGKYANNAWLQELPKPLLQLTWENAILLSPETARELKLTDGDEIELVAEGRKVRGPVLRAPGHPNATATLFFGYGRTHAGVVGNGLGYDAYAFQDHRSPHLVSSVSIRKLGRKSELALTHSHFRMEGRELVRTTLVSTENAAPAQVDESRKMQLSLYPDRPSPRQAWAMVIDLSVCIGCNSCSIACQAENNIPVVGKEQVRRSREMHWIRVDRYFSGDLANPVIYFQPVPCMHCERAPCETVCPTAATVHSQDGLNQMIYNRCVGTRYCSNNCPYKVRRFNFFQYADTKSTTLRMMQNPEVTVRSRGVMEKCTYCVQRIQTGRIKRHSEIQTACQQACPADAIVFGDKNDPASRVSQLRALPRNYQLLHELGTEPRTTYLTVVRPGVPEGGL